MGSPDSAIIVRNIRAIWANEHDTVARAIVDADYVATSVGAGRCPLLHHFLARGIVMRFLSAPDRPLDLIIAENIRDGANYLKKLLTPLLPSFISFDEYVGLVETSIGKMVPLMRKEHLAGDPLLLFAEEYNELIVDRHGFKGALPQIASLRPVENIKAYVDRKLFIHNLGHSATAYFAFVYDPSISTIWQALEFGEIKSKVRAAMELSAAALVAEYPNDLCRSDIEAHIEDLLMRFANKALGDTVYRVGRDLYRKLSHDERIIGAMLLAIRHDLEVAPLLEVMHAALRFRATDEMDMLYPRDAEFIAQEVPKGLVHILTEVSGLSPELPLENQLMQRHSFFCTSCRFAILVGSSIVGSALTCAVSVGPAAVI